MWNLKNLSKLKDMAVDMVSPSYEEDDDDRRDSRDMSPDQPSGYDSQRATEERSNLHHMNEPMQTSPLPNSYETPQRRAVPPQSRYEGWEQTQPSPSPRAADTEHQAASSSQQHPDSRETSEAAASQSSSPASRSPHAATATTRHPSLTNNASVDPNGDTPHATKGSAAPPVSSPGQTPQPMSIPDGKPSPAAPSRRQVEEEEEEEEAVEVKGGDDGHPSESIGTAIHSHAAVAEASHTGELTSGNAPHVVSSSSKGDSSSVPSPAAEPSGTGSVSRSQPTLSREDRLQRHVEKLEEKVKKHESYQKDMEARIQQYSEEVKVAHDKTVAYYEYHMTGLRKQLESKDAEIQELGRQLAKEQETRAHLEDSKTDATKYDEQLQEREKQLVDLQNMVKDLEGNLVQQRQQSEAEKKELQSEKNHLTERVQNLEARNAELLQTNSELRERVDDSEEERRDTLQRIHELERQLSEVANRGSVTPRHQMVPVAHVQDEVQSHTAVDGATSDDIQNSPGFQVELERSVEKVREAYEKRITDLQSVSAKIQEENDALQRKMEEEEREAEARFNAALQGNAHKEAENGVNAAEAAQHAEEEHKQLREEVDRLRKELAESQLTAGKLRETEERLEATSAELASTREDLDKERVACAALSSEKHAHVAEMQRTIATLQDQLKSRENDTSMEHAINEKNEEIRQVVAELETVRGAERKAVAESEQHQSEASAAHRRVEEMEAAMGRLQEHLRTLEESDSEKAGRLSAAVNEAEDLRRQLDEMARNHLENMESVKQEAAMQKHAADDEHVSQLTETLQKSHEEVHALHEQVKALAKEVDERDASLHQARERVDVVQREAAALQVECANIRSREEALQAQLSQRANKDQDSLAVVLSVKKELEEKNAHHAALISQLRHSLLDDLVRSGVDLSGYMQSKPNGVGAGGRDRRRHASEQSQDDNSTDSDDESSTDSEDREAERNRLYAQATESLSLSDLISIQASELHRLRQVAEKSDSIQTQWEHTYEQARQVNATLKNQIEESWKTIGALREEVSVKGASLQNLQMDLAKERQRYSALQEQFSGVDVAYQHVKEELERTRKDIDEKTNGDQSWAEKTQSLEGEVEGLRAELQSKDEELDSANVAVDNLQRVLEAFKEGKNRDVEERTLFLQKEVDELRAELKRREEGRHTEEGQFDQLSQQHLKQLASKNVEISTLQKKLAELKRVIEETSKQIHGDTMIDKRVISYLVVNYIHAFIAGKQLESNDIIKVLSGLLKWDEAMQEKAGLIPGPTNPRPNQGRGLMGGLVRSVFAGRGNASGSASGGTSGGDKGKDGGKRSIAEMWVDFLLQESEAAAAASDPQGKSGGATTPLTTVSETDEKQSRKPSLPGAKQEDDTTNKTSS